VDETFTLDVDATALLFPLGVYFYGDMQHCSNVPLATENAMDRLTVQLSAPTASADLRGWATGEFSNFAPTNGAASVFTPSSNYHLDTFDFVIDEGPTSE